MGNCSLSLSIGEAQDLADLFQRVETLPRELVSAWLAEAGPRPSFADYFARLRALPLGPSVAPLLGHSALRARVMGLERSLGEPARDEEVEEMLSLAREGLDAGCLGISVDMVHWHKLSGRFAGRALPSHHAPFSEIRRLAELCRERDLVFQATPNPARPHTLFQLLSLAPGLFRAPLRLTLLSALDIAGQPLLWRLFGPILFVVNRLLGGNLRFQTLTEPFRIFGDGPLSPIFEEFSTGVELGSSTDSAARRALWTPEFRARFAADWGRGFPRSFHRDLGAMFIVEAPEPAMLGRSIAALAQEAGRPPLDHFIELLAQHDTALRWTSVGANHRDAPRRRLLANPHILPGFSDAGAHCRHLAFQDSALALLREAVSSGFMAPERAIQRLTGEPARWFNLDAGRLVTGARADLLLIDPLRLQRPTPPPEPLADPLLKGAMRLVKRDPEPAVRAVFIKGQRVIDKGEISPRLGAEPLGEILCPSVAVCGKAEALARARNRIDDQTLDHPFESYAEVFLMKHRTPANVALHCLGMLLLHAGFWLGLFLHPAFLLLLPLSSGAGLIGHALFEPSYVDPRDAVFSLRALANLHRLILLVFRGRHGERIRELEGRLAEFQARDSELPTPLEVA